jgi:predicted transposase YdaD
MTTPKHDTGYKALFSEPRMVEDLLRGFVHGGWVKRLDFASLEKANTHFVSEELLRREDDVIWRLKIKGRGWLYIYLLLEFQSTPDPWMALRIMVYVGLLWQDLIKQKVVKAGEKLPPVIPVVLYNGTDPWNAPVELEELITPVRGLRAYRPRCRYLLLDEQKIALEEDGSARNLVAALFSLEQSRSAEDIAAVVENLVNWLSEPEQAGLRRAFVAWLRQALLPARLGGAPVPAVSELSEVRDMLQQRVIEWTKQWKQQGLEQGLEQGLAKGRAEGLRQAVISAIAVRFEQVPPDLQQAISEISEPTLLEQALHDVIRAQDLDEVCRQIDAIPHK